MTPEEVEELKKLSKENASTQRMLLEVRIMLKDFIKSELTGRKRAP